MRAIYTCSEHSDSVVMIYSESPLFEVLSELLETTYGVRKETFGASDITLTGEDIPLLKSQVEQAIKEKLEVFEPFGEANEERVLFGRKYRLNTRDDEHEAIYSLGMLLDMADEEMAAKGTIWFYNMSAENDMDIYLLGLFKAEEEGIELEAAFEKFRERFEQFEDVAADEFKERMEALKAHDFIVDKKADQEATLWYPTEKTLRIQTI